MKCIVVWLNRAGGSVDCGYERLDRLGQAFKQLLSWRSAATLEQSGEIARRRGPRGLTSIDDDQSLGVLDYKREDRQRLSAAAG